MFPGCGESEAATRGLSVGEMGLPSPHYLEGLHFQLANSLVPPKAPSCRFRRTPKPPIPSRRKCWPSQGADLSRAGPQRIFHDFLAAGLPSCRFVRAANVGQVRARMFREPGHSASSMTFFSAEPPNSPKSPKPPSRQCRQSSILTESGQGCFHRRDYRRSFHGIVARVTTSAT